LVLARSFNCEPAAVVVWGVPSTVAVLELRHGGKPLTEYQHSIAVLRKFLVI